jgi:hypothetical protein
MMIRNIPPPPPGEAHSFQENFSFRTACVAGRAKAPSFTGKRQEMLHPAAGTADPGEPATGIAAIQVFFNDFPDDRPEIAVRPLKTLLVFRDEALKVIEEYPVENGSLRLARTVDSRHDREDESRNRPGLQQKPNVQNRQELEQVKIRKHEKKESR